MIDARWQARIGALLAHNADLQGSSIMRVIVAEGYHGSYQTLTRYLHSVRGPTRGAVMVTMPIETVPGEEFQFDWSDCNSFARRWGWDHELHCFGCVLCWSRIKFWYFAPSIDQHHTLEGLVRFFESIGGVPAVGRTDRMGQLGQSKSKGFVFHPLALPSPAITTWPSRPVMPGTPSARARSSAPSGTSNAASSPKPTSTRPRTSASSTGEQHCGSGATSTRWPTGRPGSLRPSASRRSATCWGACPRCASTPRCATPAGWGGSLSSSGTRVFYSAPPPLAGKVIEVRQPVGYAVIELRFLGQMVALHHLAPKGSEPQWLPEHKREAEDMVLGRRRLGIVEPVVVATTP